MKITVELAIILFIFIMFFIMLVFFGMYSTLNKQKKEIESLNAQMEYVTDEYNKLNHENKKYLDGTCLPRIPRFEKGTV